MTVAVKTSEPVEAIGPAFVFASLAIPLAALGIYAVTTIAVLASVMPGRAATRVDPMEAVKAD
jgi:ABC-type antimicrobial peptide transport system permease subunit